MTDPSGGTGRAAEGSAAYRWLLVVALAAMVNVGYGTIFYSFGVSLPARFLLPALDHRVGPTLLVAAVFATLAASALAVFGASEWWRVWLYVAVFGAAFGAVLPMRAVVMSRHFGGALYGRLMGLQYAVLSLAIAGGLTLAGFLRNLTGSYATAWLGAAATLVLAAVPILLARDVE